MSFGGKFRRRGGFNHRGAEDTEGKGKGRGKGGIFYCKGSEEHEDRGNREQGEGIGRGLTLMNADGNRWRNRGSFNGQRRNDHEGRTGKVNTEGIFLMMV